MAQQDELEHSLYATAKNAESLRKKHTQTVEKLHSDLKTLKIHNARKLKVSTCMKHYEEAIIIIGARVNSVLAYFRLVTFNNCNPNTCTCICVFF